MAEQKLKVTYRYDLSERYGIDFGAVFEQAVKDHAAWETSEDAKIWRSRFGRSSFHESLDVDYFLGGGDEDRDILSGRLRPKTLTV